MDRDHQQRMNDTYGRMKYIYDLTRPFFLAGRARMRSLVKPNPGQRVLEVGCGTARNLILLRRQWPHANFTGIDISSEMLSFAQHRVAQERFTSQIALFEGELGDFSQTGEYEDHFDFILFSHSLSMIPDWQSVLRLAIGMLKPGTGELLIADFGACEKWPALAVRGLYKNLSHFHVTPRLELLSFLRSDPRVDSARVEAILGGYGQVLEVIRAAGPHLISDQTHTNGHLEQT
jgi:S-adenosylmethionine-diacylgycerolhomoserine-N-methlytransferase